LVPGAGDDRDPQLGIGGERVEDIRQLLVRHRMKRVQHLGSIDGNDQEATVDLNLAVLAHGALSSRLIDRIWQQPRCQCSPCSAPSSVFQAVFPRLRAGSATRWPSPGAAPCLLTRHLSGVRGRTRGARWLFEATPRARCTIFIAWAMARAAVSAVWRTGP